MRATQLVTPVVQRQLEIVPSDAQGPYGSFAGISLNFLAVEVNRATSVCAASFGLIH